MAQTISPIFKLLSVSPLCFWVGLAFPKRWHPSWLQDACQLTSGAMNFLIYIFRRKKESYFQSLFQKHKEPSFLKACHPSTHKPALTCACIQWTIFLPSPVTVVRKGGRFTHFRNMDFLLNSKEESSFPKDWCRPENILWERELKTGEIIMEHIARGFL